MAKRVATSSSAVPLTLPSYSLASSRLMASRGARQLPASATSAIANPFSPVMPLAKPLKFASYGASPAHCAQLSSVSGGDSALARLPLSSTDSTAALDTVAWPSDNAKRTLSGTALVANCGAVTVAVADPIFTVSVSKSVMRSDPSMPFVSPRFNSAANASSDPHGIVAPTAVNATRPVIATGRVASPSSRNSRLGLSRKLSVSRRLAKLAKPDLNGFSLAESPSAVNGSGRGSRSDSGAIALTNRMEASTETPSTSPFNCFAVSVPERARRNSPSCQLTRIGGRLVPPSASWASN